MFLCHLQSNENEKERRKKMEQKNIFFTDPEDIDHDVIGESSAIQLSEQEIQQFSKKFGFTDSQIKQFVEAFSVFDKNCDGLITSGELGQVMTDLGHRPSLQELEALIKGVDIDKDGCVNFEEFLQMMCAKIDGDEQPEAELKEVFDVMDLDQDGVISISDLHSILAKLGESISKEEAEEMVKVADFNADGVVDFPVLPNCVTRPGAVYYCLWWYAG
ncbi:hypothetical protein CAPTEDRAFT_224444 [Capitella teleta]|uniref:EF-hand domain-containing protein n=1 Tax=Capitella teleta TaxID=283909 RepID=R7TUF4_CAPTE|nr:hypothetical protein CAPTEDRAFT_224444 [Capitella teleta]|eukprot:ELT95101.1 hypothetical protein CAPTEDRAFT_224444 [Capitella teleta]